MVTLFSIRDSASFPPGERKTGLVPTWIFLKRASDGTSLTPPVIREMGGGIYAFDFDPLTAGEAAGQIDAGASLPNPGDRYIDIALTETSAQLNMKQPVPLINPNQSLGDALNAARAQGFGKWTISGTVLTLYAPDGTTPVRSFTLDDPEKPKKRE